MMSEINKRIDEGMLQWFGHVKRMEKDGFAKRVYGGECAGRPRKRWIDTVKECLKKRDLDVRQARRMVEVCEGECMGRSLVDEPLSS